MAKVAIERDARSLADVDFAAHLDHARIRRFRIFFVVGVLALATFFIGAPALAGLWVKRWLLLSEERWPQRTYLAVLGLDDDGVIKTPRGEPFVLNVTARPTFQIVGDGRYRVKGRGAPLEIQSAEAPTSEPPEIIRMRYRSDGGATQRAVLSRYDQDAFRHEFASISQPTQIDLAGGDDWLGPVRILPIDRPTVERWKVIAQAPGTSEGETEVFEDGSSQLLFLVNTKMELWVTASAPLASARLVNSTTAPVPGFAPVDERTHVARWTMKEPMALEIHLVDSEHGLASRPFYLSIGVREDRAPKVAIRATGVGRRITPNATIPLVVRALDDFGLGSLYYDVEETIPTGRSPEIKSRRVNLELPAVEGSSGVLEIERENAASIKAFAYPPGTTLKLQGGATDRCSLGAQTGVSRALVVQVVTPDELFYEILMRQRAERARFQSAVNQAEEVDKTLGSAIDAATLSGAIRRSQVIARQVSSTATRLDETLVELRLNELGTPQALDLLEKAIIRPLRELHDGKMSELRQTLSDMSTNAEAIEGKLPAARAQSAEVVKMMRTLLARMSQWESFVDVVNHLRDVMKLQQEVMRRTESYRQETEKALFDD
jgi:hypothetical protein